MRPTPSLPPDYRSIGTLDITQDRRALLFMNVAGIILLVVSGWFYLWAILRLRAGDSAAGTIGVQAGGLLQTLGLIAAVLVLTAFHVILHEAIHGIFFWWFTRSRPRFAFRWTHAYAAAPDWFLPRNAYLLTTLAPLVIITLGGLAILPIVPAGWLTSLWFVLTMNTGGAVGDLYVAGWLLRQPLTCLAHDRGDSVTLYNRITLSDPGASPSR